MSDIKTKKTNASVKAVIESVENDQRRIDGIELLDVFHDATGMQPRVWGTNIIGYGEYHYKSERSSQEGDWPLVGFSPRKASMTLYITCGFDTPEIQKLLQTLGRHKTSVSCVYINKLQDVDRTVLVQLIQAGVTEMKRLYPSAQST